MFLGRYEYRIDAKGRVPLPPRFREELKQGLVLTQGLERCIIVYPISEWTRIADRAKVITSPLPGSKERRVNRFIFTTAFSTEIDAQGRVAIPLPLRQYAEIGESVIVVGVNNCAEIWSEENWKAESDFMERESRQLSESMEGH